MVWEDDVLVFNLDLTIVEDLNNFVVDSDLECLVTLESSVEGVTGI